MTQAIFLSYASQDADAARRICDALRAAGLEVWFDQSELRGGDAWDASIRKQIKECALFVPVISANTDARPEGYFRLEWKLAVDRSHLMADDQPFFVPVILGDLSEPTARVPEKFRERQWTRLVAGLSGDAALKAFAEWIAKLSTPGDPKPTQPDSTGGASPLRVPEKTEVTVNQTNRPRRRLLAYIAAGLVAAGAVTALALLQPWKPSATQGKAGGAPSDAVLVRATSILESTTNVVADVALAEDLVKGVLDQRPTDVDATVTMARIHSYILLRGWDITEERYANAKRFSERALSLAPSNPDAMVAMATYLYRRRVELPRAVKLARDAIALAPDNPNNHRMLVNALSVTPGVADDEVLAASKQTADRFPNDALAQYEMARFSRDFGRVEDAEKYFDLAIKRGPVMSAITAQARLRLWIHNDLPGMKALLDSLPERMRTTDRAVVSQVLYGMAARNYTFASTALAGFPEPWMSDFEYTGPTALLLGEVLLLQGKTELAKIRFTEAQMELSRRKPETTRTFNAVWLESWLLMRLGKLEEARARNAIVHAELPRPYRTTVASSWIFSAIPRNLLLGERQKALELMRESAVIPLTRTFIRNAMVIDPRMEPFRNNKEIVAILAEPTSKP